MDKLPPAADAAAATLDSIEDVIIALIELADQIIGNETRPSCEDMEARIRQAAARLERLAGALAMPPMVDLAVGDVIAIEWADARQNPPDDRMSLDPVAVLRDPPSGVE